jgi:hypothetical protein
MGTEPAPPASGECDGRKRAHGARAESIVFCLVT